MNVEQLIEKLRQTAIRRAAALEAGDTRTANRAFDQLVKLTHQMLGGGPEMQQALLGLLQDEDRSVRSWAAAYALKLAPEEAVRVLRELAAGPPGFIRLNANVLLEQWEAGTLKLP